MGTTDDAEKVALERCTELELARTQLPPTMTFRPSMATRASAPPAPVDLGQLPHITLADARPVAAGAVSSAPDLEIRGTIGEGGMGRVHLVRQRSLERDVAVKTLKGDARAEAAASLLREARLTGALEHPGVIPVHALGVDDRGTPLLVMKRVEGVDWRTLLDESTHALWRERGASDDDHIARNVEILEKVCETLEFAHSRRIIHRDIKPENVMVGRFGEVYLVDWGIATTVPMEPNRAFVGTPASMAPEMVAGAAVDERTDVYLLGATLHEVLTGRPRHDAADLRQTLVAATRSQPFVYPGSVPTRLASLANRATAQQPSDRPPSARAFREELRAFLRERSVAALVDAAAARSAELAGALEAARGGPPTDLALCYRLGAEARFGFAQCLALHPEHAAARAGQRRVAESLVELELVQGHADSAAAMLRDLVDAPPELAERVRLADAASRARDRETAALRDMARELDRSTHQERRHAALWVLVVLAVLTSLTIVLGGTEMTPRMTLAPGVFMLVVSAVLLAVTRRFAANAFNRRLSLLLFMTMVAVLISRVMGVYTDASLRTIVVRDLLVSAVAAGAGAIAFEGRMIVSSLVMAAGAVCLELEVGNATRVTSAATALAFVALAWALRREPRRGA